MASNNNNNKINSLNNPVLKVIEKDFGEYNNNVKTIKRKFKDFDNENQNICPIKKFKIDNTNCLNIYSKS